MDNFLLLPRALAAALSDSAFAGAFGLVLACFLLGDEDENGLRSTLRRGTFYCLLAMLISGLVQVYLTTATMVGAASFEAVRSQIKLVMLETHAGKVLLANLAFVAVLLLTVSLRRDWQRRSTLWSLLVLLIADAAVRAASGHAASDGDFTLPEFIQFSHLISIAVWAGCVLAAGFVVLPRMLQEQRTAPLISFTRKLSRTVTFALAVVLLSGTYNSYRGLGGSLRPLAGTQWGVLLDMKILLVLAAIAMGATSRRMIGKELSLHETAVLTTAVRFEALTMLLILTVSAWLANSPPANPG
jgi:putative copper resistance protein D